MTDTPTRIAIVGGHGKVALHLIAQLRERGLEVVALARRDEHLAELEGLGATPRFLDIEAATDEQFAAAFEGCDAVVFAAGGGPDGNIARKRTVDLEGSLKSIAGARQAGIERLVQVSAFGIDKDLPDDVNDVWAAYVQAKRDADAALRDSDLDWTIVRPGGLTDDPGTGSVTLATEVERGSVSRADVAAVIAECLVRPETVGHQWELVSGDSTVSDAVTQAVA